jgi:hypothetical protein
LPSAGFGRDTVSPPRAALETLGGGVRGARQAVPTLAELQDGVRNRVEALRALQAEAENADADEANETAITEEEEDRSAPPPSANLTLEIADARARAAAQTQSFVNQVNTATGAALQRTATGTTANPPAQPNGGTVFTFARSESTPGPRFIDIRI